MGFWNGVERLMQGKPIFIDPELKQDVHQEDAPAAGQTSTEQPKYKTSLDEHGNKIIPRFTLKQCKTDQNGDSMTVTSWVVNDSNEEIELSTIEILGRTTQLNHYLSPGQAAQIQLYNGPIARNESNKTARIRYQLVRSNDYFQSEFSIEYIFESEGRYTINELREDYPVRDI